jgi:peptidyl-prolyl cis-trans isomerase SurA
MLKINQLITNTITKRNQMKIGLMLRLIIAIFIVIPNIAFSQELLIDKVVARVGSENIYLSEVEEEYSYAKANSKQELPSTAKCEMLNNLIIQKMIVHQAKLDSIQVEDSDVESQLNLRFESILQKMNGDEKFFQEYYGANVQEMKDRFRDDQKQKMLSDKMQGKLIESVKITPAEVLSFFNKIPVDSLPYLSSEVEISEIMIAPEVNEKERQMALDQMKDIEKQLDNGAKFDELAKKYSADTESAKRGGDLGFAKRGAYVPEFESAAFTLEPGKRSEIVETEFGFHIIELIERKGNTVHAKHILISPKITDEDITKAKVKLDSIRTLLVNDSIKFENAVKIYSDKNIPSYSNAGKMKNPNTGTNYFETKDLDPESYFAIDKLKISEISNVLETKNFKGEKMFRILKLQSKTAPHQINIKQDYDKIVQYAKEGKKAEYFDKWVVSKLASSKIKVDLIYSDCDSLMKYMTN